MGGLRFGAWFPKRKCEVHYGFARLEVVNERDGFFFGRGQVEEFIGGDCLVAEDLTQNVQGVDGEQLPR